jgi:hypothetical protein
MKQDDLNPAFPVIAFRSDGDLVIFETAREWRTASTEYDPGSILVDAADSAWDVIGLPRVFTGLRKAVVDFLRKRVSISPAYDYTFTERGGMPWAEVIDRTCRAIEANPDHWCNDEWAAGEDGASVEWDEQVEILQAQVRTARSLARLVELLFTNGPDFQLSQ